MSIAKKTAVLIMIYMTVLFPQSRFSLGGFTGTNGSAALGSFESDGVLSLPQKDWVGMLRGGNEAGNGGANVLYEIGFGKTIGSSNIYLRFTPGYRREFSFVKDENYLVNDSTDASLNSLISFSEQFAAAYSYRFSGKLKGGVQIRNFARSIEDNTVGVVFTEDTLYLISEKQSKSSTRWQFDLGLTYNFSPDLWLNLSTHNLYVMSDENSYSGNAVYKFNDETAVSLLAGWQWSSRGSIRGSWESNGSMLGAAAYNLLQGEFTLGGGVAYFRNTINKTFDGIIPSLSMMYKDYGLQFSSVIYTSGQEGFTASEFEKNPVASLINDSYSGNKYILSFIYNFNVASAKPVTISDVEITGDIFPVLADEFADKPIARVKVVNLTGSKVQVKPESFIEELNSTKISSPQMSIGPYDTVWVPVYTIPSENYSGKKTRMTTVKISLYTENSADAADEAVRPVLVHGVNAWDGKTKNLRYFVKRELMASAEKAKKIVTGSTTRNDSTAVLLRTFRSIKDIYNAVVPGLTYVADPVATADFVQYPSETMQSKGGDCDDMSVLFASFFEGIGIETAFVDYASADGISHVNLLVNTGLDPEQAFLITSNEKKYHIRKDVYGKEKVWIPLETTDLTGFDGAWSNGAERFHREAIGDYGLVKGSITIIDIY